MMGLRRLSSRELAILLVLVVSLGGLGFFASLESEVTPVWSTAQEKISLSADGLGIFMWKIEGGFWAKVAERKSVFDVSPSTHAQIVSLNGQPVGGASGIGVTDRSGRVVVVLKVASEGPIQIKGTDLRTGKSATAVRWSTAD